MKIDFYIYDTPSRQQAYYAACHLIEKIHAEESHSIFINMNTHNEAERFDALLWTYRDDSFLPHALSQSQDINPPRIQIGHSDSVIPNEKFMLINFAQAIPPFYSEFQHMFEIVFNDATVQQFARERYKHYRDQGCQLNTIKLKVTQYD